MMIKTATIQREVEKLHRRDGGCNPHTLVNEAADPKHPLHGAFEWDDARAGHEYRVGQARSLITRVVIHEKTHEGPKVARVYVSPRRDSEYKSAKEVDPEESLFKDARNALRGWQRQLAAFENGQKAAAKIEEAIEALS